MFCFGDFIVSCRCAGVVVLHSFRFILCAVFQCGLRQVAIVEALDGRQAHRHLVPFAIQTGQRHSRGAAGRVVVEAKLDALHLRVAAQKFFSAAGG